MRTLAVMTLLSLLLASCTGTSEPTGDLATAIDGAVAAVVDAFPGATVAVSVRDPSTGATYDRLGDRLFHAASTMKVPVMIELFRLAESGQLGLDDSLLVENSFRSIVDGSMFSIEDDSDDAIYERLGSRMAVRDLITQMIVVSSNLATNLLVDTITADSVQATSERLGTRHMKTLRGVEDLKAFEQGLSNRATSADLALLFEKLLAGEAISEQADASMIDVLLDQHFNGMIPAGLPEGTRMAHKTGRITAVDHDAGIVYPEGGAPFILVILTEGLENPDDSETLGSQIGRAVFDILRPGDPE